MTYRGRNYAMTSMIAALKSAGDDYPGSSFQQWCYEQAGIPLSASPKLGEVLQQIRAERATSPTDAGQEQ